MLHLTTLKGGLIHRQDEGTDALELIKNAIGGNLGEVGYVTNDDGNIMAVFNFAWVTVEGEAYIVCILPHKKFLNLTHANGEVTVSE